MTKQNEARRSVLVVDDEELICELLCRWLSPEGYQCRAAFSASAALAALAEESFDLLLLDINMPETTGLAILREVGPRYPDLGIIMITAVEEQDIAFDTMALGADGFLNKPITRLELILTAANVIMRRQLARQNRQQQAELSRLVAEKTQELQEALDALRKSHAQILQQEKMAAVGQLAAGVAHEINNPVGFIHSNLTTLAKYLGRFADYIAAQQNASAALPEESRQPLTAKAKELKIDYSLKDAKELIDECLEGTERVKEITMNLKNFSRVDQQEQQATDLNTCLEETLRIVWNELKYKATVIKDYGDLPETVCHHQQMNQVFVNILVNAAQAMVDKGEIRIRTWAENGFIYVAISDTGPGVPEAIRHRLFEPFFTTKEVGKGTGLGLSISYDIVKKHGGDITLASEMGQGTTFTVQLPVREADEKSGGTGQDGEAK